MRLIILVLVLSLTACSGVAQQPDPTAPPGGEEVGQTSDVIEVQVELSEFAFTTSVDSLEAGRRYRFVVHNAGTVEHEWVLLPAGGSAEMMSAAATAAAGEPDGEAGSPEADHDESEDDGDAATTDDHDDAGMSDDHESEAMSDEHGATATSDESEPGATSDPNAHQGGHDHASVALAQIPASELQPGDTVIREVTIPADAGDLEFGCHLPGHFESGMVLTLPVSR